MFNWLTWFFVRHSRTGTYCAYDDLPIEIRDRLYNKDSIVSIEKQVSILITTNDRIIKYTYNPITGEWRHMSEAKYAS